MAVLDWAGELDQRLQGLHDLRGLLRRVWRSNCARMGRRAQMGEFGGFADADPFETVGMQRLKG